MKFKRSIVLLIIIIALSAIWAFLLIKGVPPRFDEANNRDQIVIFIGKNFPLDTRITTGPGYHLSVAGVAYLLGLSSLDSLRSITLFFSLLSILVFFLISKNIHESSPIITTLQYYFFPILFPFFFLIYTDAFSLFLILLSLYAIMNGKYSIAGAVMILSTITRQNNIIWLVFMGLFIYMEDCNFDLKLSKWGVKFKFNGWLFKRYLKKCWTLIAGIILFMIFVIVNKGVALGDKTMHPSFSFYLGNIYFILFLFFFLFLPFNISNYSRIAQLVKKNKIIIFLITVGFMLHTFTYMFTFKNTHPYNQSGIMRDHYFFLRNVLLVYFSSYTFLKALFFITITYSTLSLIVTKLHRRSFYLIYPMSFLYLTPQWLIEQRYYLIPFSLFILFKERKSKLVEYLTIIYYMIASVILFHGIVKIKFFL